MDKKIVNMHIKLDEETNKKLILYRHLFGYKSKSEAINFIVKKELAQKFMMKSKKDIASL